MPQRSSRAAYGRHAVTAIVVAHDGARWLPDTITSLGAQVRPPQRVVAVDTGSTDTGPALLRSAFGDEAVVTAPRATGFGAAVQQGVELIPPAPRRRAADVEGRVEWLWLLHDDCAPDPSALLQLLAVADSMPSAGVIGPKTVDWNDRRLLVEIGVTTDGAGHRETGLERREFDQGQHDMVRDVLAVGSAGALIRRDLWDSLNGYDAQLPLLRDDIDFGWRANLAGHRVVVAPQAIVRHARAAVTGRRPASNIDGRLRRTEREHAIYTVLANVSRPGLLLAIPRLLLGAVLVGLALLLTRRPQAAADEVLSLIAVLRRPGVLRAARRARRQTRRVGHRSVHHLLASPRARLRAYADLVADRVATGGGGRGELVAKPVETGPTSDDQDEMVGGRPWLWRTLAQPAVALTVVLLGIALLAERRLLGSGALSGGALLPAPGGASDLWQTYTSAWHQVGIGSASPAPPYLAVVATVSTVLFGHASIAVDILLLGAVPLAGLLAYLAAGVLTRSTARRIWVGATYALVPALTGAIAGGRLGTTVAIALLPVGVLVIGRAIGSDPRNGGWHRAYLAGLVLAVISAFDATAYPIAVLSLFVVSAWVLLHASPATRSGAVRRGLAALLVLVVPLVLLEPWTWHVISHPRLLAAGVGVPLPSSTTRSWQLLLTHPAGPGTGPIWAYAAFAAAGLVALAAARQRGVLGGTWVLAASALVVGSIVSRTHVSAVSAAGYGWPGLAAAAVVAAFLAGAVAAAEGARERLARQAFGWRQPTIAVVTAATLLAPVVAGIAWLHRGADRPVRRATASQVLPPFLRVELQGRVLVLRVDQSGGVHFAVVRGTPPQLGDSDVSTAADAGLAATLRAILTLTGRGSAAALAAYDISYVVVPQPTPTISAPLDSDSAVQRVPVASKAAVYRVLTPHAQFEVLAPGVKPAGHAVDGAVLAGRPPQPLQDIHPAVPDGASGRLLLIAAPASRGWHASVGRTNLHRGPSFAGLQTFQLPATGGQLHVSYDATGRDFALVVQLVALIVVLILSAPPRRDIDEHADATTPDSVGQPVGAAR